MTFVFTDIEGSTRLLNALGDDYVALLDEHNRIIREAVAEHGGVEVRTVGDAFFLVFSDPRRAACAVIDAQRRLRAHSWPQHTEVRVRIGLHSGVATNTGDDYIGLVVHEASRIGDAGNGGQIILSANVADAIADALPDGASLHDLGHHRLRDIVELHRLFELRHDALPPVEAPLRTLSERPNNLPAQVTTFVGRHAEGRDIKTRVLEGTRLLTLVGPGGSGKTRLSLEVAGELLGDFTDGVWLIELARIASDDLVPDAAAAALGIREEQGRAIIDTITDRLRSMNALLLLDNCEHVVGGASAFAQNVMRACPGTQILATSREPLSIEGESTWMVPTLSLPKNGEVTAASEAVRLFVERASASNSQFALTETNAPKVSEICRRLDGIPLALELAAARVGVLSVEQICDRLDDRFQLLTRGYRDAMPRQQTLRALVDWSYDLLDENEQLLLTRLSVFAGGFTLEAAEEVSSAPPISRADVLDVLSGLIRRSLLQVEHVATGGVRYRLLETIREYAHEKLVAGGGHLDARSRHRAWISDLASGMRGRDFSSEAATLHDQLELETPNIRAALTSALEDDGAADDGLRICADLGYYWWLRGHNSEGEAWLERALAAPGTTDRLSRGHALAMLGLLRFERLELDIAMALLEEALAIGEESGEVLLTLRAYTWLGACLTARGDFAAAREMLDRRFLLGEDQVVEPERAGWFYLLGSLYLVLGDAEASRRYLDQSIALARRIAAPYVLVRALPVAANNALAAGDVDAAADLYAEALDMARQTNDRVGIARSLVFLAEASLEIGDYDGANVQLREATPIITREIGFPALRSRLDLVRGTLEFHRGRYDDAARSIQASLDTALGLGRDKEIASARITKGAVALALGDIREAETELGEALVVARRIGDSERICRALELVSRAALLRGDIGAARLTLEEAGELADRVGVDTRLAMVEHGWGLVALAEGDAETAGRLLERALGRRRAIGNGLDVAETLEALAHAAFTDGDAERAASLLGAAHARREALSCPAPTSQADANASLEIQIRARIGDEAFTREWSTGQSLERTSSEATLTHRSSSGARR